MVLNKKKGLKGNAASYTTRNQALVRLQIKLPEFRRLCILKGIHPREPKKKTKGSNKTYYHVKDINFLAHEPLLHLARNIKAHDKKIRRAKGRGEQEAAARLAKSKPRQSLDHLVKERYPSFLDALRDLDDALTLVHLFAVLPADATHKIPAARVHAARRLSLEWQAYVTRTHALRKVFVSVKGYYFQAEVIGQQLTWLVPHQLAQVIPDDVDFRVMLTFLEFHETLLGFVHFKLYHELGLPYPPSLDPRLERAAAELYAVMRELASAALKQKTRREGRLAEAVEERGGGEAPGETRQQGEEQGEQEEQEEQEEGGEADDGSAGSDAGEEAGEQRDVEREAAERLPGLRAEQTSSRMASLQSRLAAMQAVAKARGEDAAEGEAAAAVPEVEEEDEEEDEEARACRSLFKGLVFFLAREVPREALMFVIRSFGGRVTWEGEEAPLDASDGSITHQVVDRPQRQPFPSRSYVQPQWVFDCANARILLPCDLYAPGVVCPPHLSPFVDHQEEGYVPDYAATVQRLKAAAAVAAGSAGGAGGQAGAPASIDGGLLEWEGARERQAEEGAALVAAARFEDDEEAVEAARRTKIERLEQQYARDLALELSGVPFSASLQAEGGKGESQAREEGEDEEDGEVQDDQEIEEREGAHAADQAEAVPAGLGSEEKEMARMLMTRKRRGLYDAMQMSNAKKAAHVAALQKRKALAAHGGVRKTKKQRARA